MRSEPLFTRVACLGLSLIPVKERERVPGKVSDQTFVNSCLANSPSVYKIDSSTHLITLSALHDCLSKQLLHRMSLITHNAKKYLHNKCHKIYLSGPFGSLSLLHPNHFVLEVTNNRNVIITFRFLAAPVQGNQDFFWHTDFIFQP